MAVIGVRAMLRAFAALGLDVRRIQDRAAISDRDLADPDRLLPASALYRMWEIADGLWGRPALGLSAGSSVTFGTYEVLDYLLSSGATLGAGIRGFAACFALATRTATYEIDEACDPIRCEMRWRIPPQGVMFHVRDYSLAAVARRVRDAGGGAPARVEIAGPPLAQPEQYSRLLAAPVTLRAGANALLFTRERWTAALPRADESLHRTLHRHAELLLERAAAAAGDSLAQRVRCLCWSGSASARRQSRTWRAPSAWAPARCSAGSAKRASPSPRSWTGSAPASRASTCATRP